MMAVMFAAAPPPGLLGGPFDAARPCRAAEACRGFAFAPAPQYNLLGPLSPPPKGTENTHNE